MRDLFQKRRSGDITDEEFRQKIQEMREKYPDLMRSGRGSRGGRQREDRNR